MYLGKIIKSYREINKMTMEDFSKASGLSRGYISMLEKNENTRTHKEIVPTIDCIQKCAKAMFMPYDELFNMIDNRVQNEIGVSTKKSIIIPVLGNVAAGTPIEAIEEVIGYEEISETLAHTGEFFALKIKGDSMYPKIENGSIVIVRKQDYVTSGEIAIVLVNGDDATCKKIAKYPSGMRLIPLNEKYEPLFFSNEEIMTKPVNIIGKVVEIRTKLE